MMDYLVEAKNAYHISEVGLFPFDNQVSAASLKTQCTGK